MLPIYVTVITISFSCPRHSRFYTNNSEMQKTPAQAEASDQLQLKITRVCLSLVQRLWAWAFHYHKTWVCFYSHVIVTQRQTMRNR